jgi:hypothetical protein
MMRPEKGVKIKVRYAEYDWAVRGVFFRAHELASDNCSLRPIVPTVATPVVSNSPITEVVAQQRTTDPTSSPTSNQFR